ncbi:hypothetical protein OG963_42335 [Streptomyces sp. NBC_01707]|uniref:hypothetical protein n=1 Tax=Streptomyces sp. NBC_01707 TaxID=2975914 RepID=UPI00352FBDE0
MRHRPFFRWVLTLGVLVSAVPVARLFKEVSVSRAVRDVEAAGARTARDVLDAGVSGLGHMDMDRSSAEHAHTAARRLADNMEATLSVRVDPVAPGPPTVALLVALQVLLDAGAEVHQTARAGEELAGEFERVLTEAEPASGYLSMLRVPDDRNLGLSARADFESRTSQYYGLLAQVVDSENALADH